MKYRIYISILFLMSAVVFPEQLYSSRPDILKDIKASRMESNLPPKWSKIKKASMGCVAELLAMYPEEEIYFLARDSETIYDMAMELTEDFPEVQKRIHLLNISRSNMYDGLAMDYLEQEGISVKNLKNKRAVIIDTGYAGSVPSKLQSILGSTLSKRISFHMITSGYSRAPSSRVFIEVMNPDIEPDPHMAHRDIVKGLEHISHFTEKSDGFTKSRGKIVATSSQRTPSQTQRKAKDIMADIKHYAQRNKKDFLELWEAMDALTREYLNSEELTDSKRKKYEHILDKNGINSFKTDLKEAKSIGNIHRSSSKTNCKVLFKDLAE